MNERDILNLRMELLDYWREAHSRWDLLLDVYHGNYHELWPAEFRRGEVPKVANWIKLGWDRYAKMVGKIPTNHVPPNSLQRITQRRADKVEHILVHYDNQSGINSLMKWYAWYLVGFGSAAMGVMPDPVLKGPRYFVKDPRIVLPEPGAGSVPITSSAYGMLSEPRMHTMSMSRVILNESMTASAVKDTYENISGIEEAVGDSSALTPVSVITYMDKEVMTLLINEKTVLEIEHDLGFVPVRMTSQYVPEQLGGQSQFEQTIGLVLAYIRILNQKLTYNGNVVWPWLVLRGLHNIDPNERVIEIMDQTGDATFLSPPGELQIERDLDVLDRLIRVMNHDTESLQGEAPGSGTVTGPGVDSLNRDATQMVLDYWDLMKPDIEFIKASALAIDEKVYPSAKKEIFGKAKGEQFQDTYTPSKDIRGYRNVTIDFGIGVGGLEGFTQLMQTAAQGYIDEQSVMENLPYIRSVSETRRKVMLDRLEKVVFEMVAQQAPAELINHMTNWMVAIQAGKEPYKWISENPFPPPAPQEGALIAPPGAPGALPLGAQEGAPPAIPNIPSPSQIMALAQGRQ